MTDDNMLPDQNIRALFGFLVMAFDMTALDSRAASRLVFDTHRSIRLPNPGWLLCRQSCFRVKRVDDGPPSRL